MTLGVTDRSHLFELDQGMRKVSLEELVEACVALCQQCGRTHVLMTEMEQDIIVEIA